MSFRRAVAPVAASVPSGTKRWLDGALLVSTGLASLDAALGGGVPLGSLVLLEEDACGGKLASTLASLFAAESLAAGHTLITAGADGRGGGGGDTFLDTFLHSLPFCSSSGSADAAARAADAAAAIAAGLNAADIVEDDTGVDVVEKTLATGQRSGLSSSYAAAAAAAIALTAESETTRGVGGSSFCHTFDLSRRTTLSYLSSLIANGRIRKLNLRALYQGAFADPSVLQSANLSAAATAAATRINIAEVLLRAQAVALRKSEPSTTKTSNINTPFSDVSSLSLVGALAQAAALRARSEGCPYADLLAQLAPIIGAGGGGGGGGEGGDASTVHITRLVLVGLGGIAWPGCTGNDTARARAGAGAPGLAGAREHAAAQPLLHFFTELATSLSRGRLGKSPCVALVVVPTWALPRAVSASLRARAAVVLKLHGLGDPAYTLGGDDFNYDKGGDALEPAAAARGFPKAAGVLIVRRLPAWGHAAPQTSIGGDEWVITRERRKIGLEKPHPPPEEATSESATMSCSTSGGGGGGGKSGVLDF